MKKKLLFLVILLLVFVAAVGIRFLLVSRGSQEGRLHIVSSPAANVIINDKAVGRTPFEASLEEGEYAIKLVPDEQEASQSATWNGKVRIFHKARTFVSREIGINEVNSSGVILTVQKMEQAPEKKGTGQIEVRTKPDGGIVFLDDEEQGISPLILSEVPEGDHELSVTSPGFFRRSQQINVQGGYRVTAEYTLAIDPTHKKVVKEDDPEATDEATLKDGEEAVDGTPTPTPALTTIEILQTSTGWLRVRAEPSINASESARVDPGDTFAVLEERSGWYKIEYEAGEEGWISAQYTREVGG